MLDRLRQVCQRLLPRCPALLVMVGVVLALPSLFGGLQLDDYGIRESVLDCRPWGLPSPGALQPFSFLDGDPSHTRALIDRGVMPWWTNPHCRIRFMRPLTAVTHIADHRLWPNHPWLMHLQNLAWFGLLIWVAAVAYRRLMGRDSPPWVAVLAALLFTLDDAHGGPVGWLANRNTLLAATFGILAIIAYDRWRRDGWRPGALAAPLLLLAGLLCKELAVCAGAYMLAYALFIDRGRWQQRIAALLPSASAGVAWYIAYRMLGFGVSGSGVYLDPGSDTLLYLRNVFHRGPVFLLGQWALPDSTISLVWSARMFMVHWIGAILFLIVLAVLLVPLIKRDAVARFWALGMLLSLLPACAVLPSDRLLMYVGFGAMGLLAQFLSGLQSGASWLPRSAAWQMVARPASMLFVLLHLIAAPLMLIVSANAMGLIGRAIERPVDTFPADDKIERQTVVLVNSSCWLLDAGMIGTLHYRGRPLPEGFINLSTTSRRTTLTRIDEKTLSVRPEGGYLPPAGRMPEPAPPASWIYAFQVADLLVANAGSLPRLGDVRQLPAATVKITELTEDGRPAEATFSFKVPLEDGSLRWLELTSGGYRAFTLPEVGRSVDVHSTAR